MSQQATASEGLEVEADAEEERQTVQGYLELAVRTAAGEGMNTSELLGLFYYYTHSLADSYRREALEGAMESGPEE